MADPISFVASSAFSLGMSYLFPSEGPRLKDLKVSASTYGAPIPEAFGTVRVGANMIWSAPIKERKKKKLAGKGGGFYNEYSYFGSFAMAFCAGPITAFRRIWADGKLIYDATGGSEVVQSGKYKFRLYKGGEDQLPDALIQAERGENNAPAYRGIAYVVFEDMPLKDFGNRLPQMAAEVLVEDGVRPLGVVTDLDFAEWTQVGNRAAVFKPDWNRGYIYTLGSSPAGIARFKTSDGLQDRERLGSQMALPNTSETYHQDGQINAILGVLDDGSVIISHGGANNYQPIARIDPNSMTFAGGIYRSTPFGGTDRSTFPAVSAFNGRSAVNGNNICLVGQVGAGPTQVAILNNGTAEWARSTEFVGGNAVHHFPDCNKVVANLTEGGAAFFGIVSNTPFNDITDYASIFQIVRINGVLKPVLVGDFTKADAKLAGSAFPLQVVSAAWDQADPGILFECRAGSNYSLVKWSLDSEDIVWSLRIPSGLPSSGLTQCRLLTGDFAWVSGNRYYAVDTITGQFVDRDADRYVEGSDPDDDFSDGSDGVALDAPVDGSSFQSYDSLRQMIATASSLVRASGIVGGGTTLASIIQRVLEKGGMSPAQYDLTALETVPVRGYGWASNSDVKSIIEALKMVYLFDLVEIDGRLTARLRGDEVTDTTPVIPQAVLGSTSGEAMDFWQEKRLSEADLPERVSLVYMNVDDDFETSHANSQRITNPLPTMFSRQTAAFEMSLVLTPTEAKNMVNKMLYSQWSERTQHNTRLPWAFMDLDPSDLIVVRLDDGRTYFERIHQTEFGANYAIEMETFGQDSGSYESDAVGDGGGAGRTQTVTLAKPAFPVIFNTPLLRDVDDTGGGSSRYYTAIGQDATGDFSGAAMFKSINDQDYETLYSDNQDVEWGSVPVPTPDASQGSMTLDWETQITIFPGVSWFSLESITDDELWNGANLCVLGDEVIQFRDAVQNEDGSWTIWNLLRGRRGTEYACGAHQPGERFYFLSNDTVTLQGDVITARGQDRFFKAVGDGLSVNAAPATKVNYEPRDLMPYAPVHLERTIDEVSGDITLTWKRRTRMGGNLVDGIAETPLNEVDERYEVYLLDAPFDGDLSRGAPPAEFRRKIDVLEPQIVYSAADQMADSYVADIDTLHVAVYQISQAVGRGFPGVRSIEPWRDV